jgi:hypothetical protein
VAASRKPRAKKAKSPALPKRGRGQPLTFTPAVGKAIVDIVKEHGFEETAAESLGVARQTVADWRDRGKRGDPLFVDFFHELMIAKANHIRKVVDEIRGHKDWKAKQFILCSLERSFLLATKVEHSGPDGAPIQAQVTHTLSDEQATAVREKILGIGQKDTDGQE